VQQLLIEVGEPASLSEMGIARAEFEDSLLELAKAAFTDPSMRTNPRIPLISEIIELLQLGFAG
jgi:acetaldehyde dehydrogenase / alcohol dehydrogenase